MVAGLLSLAFVRGLDAVSFHNDESSWIARSNVFELFVGGHIFDEAWKEDHANLTQPPVTSYLIGLSRRLGGWKPSQLNSDWDWSETDRTNRARGAMPSDGLLWWARLPMALLAVFCGTLMYVLVVRSVNRVAGGALLVGYSVNTYFHLMLRRAMSEAPSLIGFLIALVLTDRLLDHRSGEGHSSPGIDEVPEGSPLWIGFWIGTAAEAKHNAILALPAAVAAMLVASRSSMSRDVQLDWLKAAGWTAILTLAVFIAWNPFLYRHTLHRIRALVEYRQVLLAEQAVQRPSEVIRGWAQRSAVVTNRLFIGEVAYRGPGALALNSVLFLVGVGTLVAGARSWLLGRSRIPTPFVILVFWAFAAIPMLMTPLDWDRYFLLPVTFVTVCSAAAVGFVARLVLAIR